MKEGEIAKVVVSPKYAFGQYGNQHGFHGSGGKIPGNATLEFQVELLDWKPAKKVLQIQFKRFFTKFRTQYHTICSKQLLSED
jgi:ribosomal protein L21E